MRTLRSVYVTQLIAGNHFSTSRRVSCSFRDVFHWDSFFPTTRNKERHLEGKVYTYNLRSQLVYQWRFGVVHGLLLGPPIETLAQRQDLFKGRHSIFWWSERMHSKLSRQEEHELLVKYTWIKVRGWRGEVDVLGTGEMSAAYLLHPHCLLSWSGNYHRVFLLLSERHKNTIYRRPVVSEDP